MSGGVRDEGQFRPYPAQTLYAAGGPPFLSLPFMSLPFLSPPPSVYPPPFYGPPPFYSQGGSGDPLPLNGPLPVGGPPRVLAVPRLRPASGAAYGPTHPARPPAPATASRLPPDPVKAAEKAARRLQALYPRLSRACRDWLCHRLVAGYAGVLSGGGWRLARSLARLPACLQSLSDDPSSSTMRRGDASMPTAQGKGLATPAWVAPGAGRH